MNAGLFYQLELRGLLDRQIIVLTCRLRTFAPLGGHTLRVQTRFESSSALAA